MNKQITFTQALLTGIGLVIGSGIFFRADDILKYTEGNIGIAVLAWIILGLTLAFGGIAVSLLAARSKREGGMIGYIEDCYGKTAAFVTGWFETIIFIPAILGILGIVAAEYLIDLFGMQLTTTTHMLVAALLIIMVMVWNYFSTRFAAMFSSAATIIKLLPIVIIGTIGMASFDPDLVVGSKGLGAFELGLFTAPLLSMAFAFDGWLTVASLSRDMKNPQRDLSIVLAVIALIVTVAYTLYFTGITMLMPAQEIIDLGNLHVSNIVNNVLGPVGGKVMILCIVMSVMGTLNGNTMAGFRYPHALAQAGDLPNSKYFATETKYGTTGRAAMFTMIATAVWFVLYTIQAYSKASVAEGEPYLFSTITFDDIPIMGIAIIIIFLLIGTIRIGIKEKNIFKGIISSIIGLLGQIYVVISFVQTNQSAFLYMGICIAIILIGLFMRSQLKKSSKQTT